MRPLYAFLLLIFLIASASEAKPRRKGPSRCERLSQRLDRKIKQGLSRAKTCKADEDCELEFHGNSSGCDLGFALSKRVLGRAYFRELESARRAAEDSCPSPEDQMYCQAEPYRKAVCDHGSCQESY